MAMDGCSDSELGKFSVHEEVPFDSKDMGEIGNAMEALTRVDLDLAYSSEKLVNLDTLLMHVLAWEHDFKVMATDDISVDYIEKALAFDLLSGILDSEVRELERFMGTLQALIVDARIKISSCGHLRELFTAVEVKLYDSEESLKQSQEHALEMKMQLAKLQMKSLAFNPNDWKYNRSMSLSDDCQVSVMKPQMQTVEQRHVLRMLEKSLARELDLEKKLTELKQNEEDLKLKLRLTEQVSFCMEEAAEVVWGRFLEAENAAEVLMGISKEMFGRLQIVQFTQNGSTQREDMLKSNLQDCLEQLKAKDNAIQKLNSSITQLMKDNSEVPSLREKIKLLEEQLRGSESQLKKEIESNEASQVQLREMDNAMQSLKENLYEAEDRAETAETKIMQLTDTNLELTEELGLLKSSNDSNTKKVSVLEKQSRELELQLQHAKASSEASQEQQNMLYSAIWDMETLVDELKQKVSRYETNTENAEEQCIILTDTNLELGKELHFLRDRVECLESSLNEANVEKIASAKDINIKTNLIMDMVMQLATERERIKKQIYSITVENKFLLEKLQNQKDGSASMNAFSAGDSKDFPFSRHDKTNARSAETASEVATESSPKIIQKEELTKEPSAHGTEVGSISASNATNLIRKLDGERVVEKGQHKRLYVYMAILVLLLSVLATYLVNRKIAFINVL